MADQPDHLHALHGGVRPGSARLRTAHHDGVLRRARRRHKLAEWRGAEAHTVHALYTRLCARSLLTAALCTVWDAAGEEGSSGSIVHYSWASVNLLAVARHTPEMLYVLRVVRNNFNQLLKTLVFALLLIYIFSVTAYVSPLIGNGRTPRSRGL